MERFRPWATHPRTYKHIMLSKPVTWDKAWEILRNHVHELMEQNVPEWIINQCGVIALWTDEPSKAQQFQHQRNQMLLKHFEGKDEQNDRGD